MAADLLTITTGTCSLTRPDPVATIEELVGGCGLRPVPFASKEPLPMPKKALSKTLMPPLGGKIKIVPRLLPAQPLRPRPVQLEAESGAQLVLGKVAIPRPGQRVPAVRWGQSLEPGLAA